MNVNQQEVVVFEIISHAGNARSLAYEALDYAEENKFRESDETMKRAVAELDQAHRTQTMLITDELNGTPAEKTLLLIHAQDHLMTAISEQKLIERMIRLVKRYEQQ